MIADAAQKRGHKVLLAKDGTEVIANLRQRPDIIVMDVMMPKMDGPETLEHLRGGEHRHIPVVMLSAGAGHMTRDWCADLGAADYIVKPFDLERLFHRLDALVAQSRGK